MRLLLLLGWWRSVTRKSWDQLHHPRLELRFLVLECARTALMAEQLENVAYAQTCYVRVYEIAEGEVSYELLIDLLLLFFYLL